MGAVGPWMLVLLLFFAWSSGGGLVGFTHCCHAFPVKACTGSGTPVACCTAAGAGTGTGCSCDPGNGTVRADVWQH